MRALAALLFAPLAFASTGDERTFYDAFDRVRVGMSIDEVQQLGERGPCTDWPKQRPPQCGPLRYFLDRQASETASGRTVTYWYGREALTFRDGRLILIQR